MLTVMLGKAVMGEVVMKVDAGVLGVDRQELIATVALMAGRVAAMMLGRVLAVVGRVRAVVVGRVAVAVVMAATRVATVRMVGRHHLQRCLSWRYAPSG